MKPSRLFFTVIFLKSCLAFIPVALAQVSGQAQDDADPLLLVSFDGFRSDYAQRWQLENFLRLAQQGTRAEGLVPVYPSKTFPNHYTLVTGLYPGTHGLADNSFHDPQRDLAYSIGNRSAVEDAEFYDGVPLWQHVQKHGLLSASYFWVGSEAAVSGSYPDYYRVYDSSVANAIRVSQVLEWLRLPAAERPTFISLYFSLVDSASHDFGPLAEQTRAAAEEADRLLGALMDGLAALPLAVNLVVVSDHGMYPVMDNPDSLIYLSELAAAEDKAVVVYNQTQVLVYSDDALLIDNLHQTLGNKAQHFSVYKKQETPEHWHYRDHANIGSLVVAAEPGYVLSRTPVADREFGNQVIGVHGYDARELPELHGIFYAWGPGVQQGLMLPAFENVHVLPFLTQLLGLPAPEHIDGQTSVLQPALRQNP